EAIHPASFALFDAAQYDAFDALYQERASAGRAGEDAGAPGAAGPLPEPFREDTATDWVPGQSLVDSRPVWIPAHFVYLPYRPRRGDAFIDNSSSTGVACGRSRGEAVLKALYEVVERDATSIFWLAKLSPPRLLPTPDSELDRLWRERLATPGMEMRLLDLTPDSGLPTAAAFLLHENGGAVVGSATRHSLAEAARKALLEAIQGQLVWRDGLRDGPHVRYSEDFADVVEFPDHARAYLAPGMRRHLDFLWRHPEPRHLPDGPGAPDAAEGLRTAIEALAPLGLEPFAVDITSPDVRRLGYWVMRVVVPGAVPLNAQHDRPYLGSDRLRQMPARLGLESNLAGAAFNPACHPFP
ncbi:MAG: YcaO-like family protein, partial [Acidobacteriota bacterium]